MDNRVSKFIRALKVMLDELTNIKVPGLHKRVYNNNGCKRFCMRAVLSQQYGDKQLPVAFASRSFTPGESNKAIIEKELAAIHWAVKFFRPYVFGKSFKIKTDHRPLTYLFSMKNPSSKLTRMRLDLEEFDFEVEFLAGKLNYAADALSRITLKDLKGLITNEKQYEKIYKVTTRAAANRKAKVISDVDTSTPLEGLKLKVFEPIKGSACRKYAKIRLVDSKLVLSKGKLILIKANLSDLQVNGNIDLDLIFQTLMRWRNRFKIDKFQLSRDDHLFTKYGIGVNQFKDRGNNILRDITIAIVPATELITDRAIVQNILNEFHDHPLNGGHSGISRTIAKIKDRFHWRNMTNDIRQYIKNCGHCKKNKTTQHIKEEMVVTDTPTKAFDRVVVDTVGPLPKSLRGNEYAVTLICDLTKYLVTIPVPNKQAGTIAKAIFENFILTYGTMGNILTDMGTEYKNNLMTELCKLLNVKHQTSTAYHHQSLGTVERNHRTLNEYLRSYISVDKLDWDDWLGCFTYCYNVTPSIIHDYCPFELVFGRGIPNLNFLRENKVEPFYNHDAYDKEIKYRLQLSQVRAHEELKKAKLRQKLYYDRQLNPIKVKVGDLVMVRNESGHKLDNVYNGPYTVIDLDNKNNIKIKIKNKHVNIHKNRIKMY